MKEIRRQNFVVVEGSVVVGSFVTLRDALAVRARSGTILTRIMADHGEFDEAWLHAAEPSAASVELSVKQPSQVVVSAAKHRRLPLFLPRCDATCISMEACLNCMV